MDFSPNLQSHRWVKAGLNSPSRHRDFSGPSKSPLVHENVTSSPSQTNLSSGELFTPSCRSGRTHGAGRIDQWKKMKAREWFIRQLINLH